ncbi:MAG: hypothetical protein P4L34_01685 [Paludibacter sp.]|nr:hypothetical protein [Paludibacter sp.]
MKKINRDVFFLLSLIILISCDSREKLEKQADIRLKHIELLIKNNSLNAAQIEIDSINLLFPRLVNKRRIAAAFQDTILRRESARNLNYCDSILPIKQHEADSIEKNFKFEKNDKYQDFGNYVYKTEQTENNAYRTYLKTYVDENADFYLISNYCGSNISQNSVEVSVNDLSAHTDTIETSNPNYHSYNDEGSHWETLTFKNEADKGLTAFITQNVSLRIKVTLHGKRSYVYYLSDGDKKAIAETYHLWVVKKDVSKLQKEIKKNSFIIERIKNQEDNNQINKK